MARDSVRRRAGRHDHRSRYGSDHFQKELAFLGIAFLGIDGSPVFVRSPPGNGRAARFIRTLKENVPWVRTCKTIPAKPSRSCGKRCSHSEKPATKPG